jgi:hypothetical protein
MAILSCRRALGTIVLVVLCFLPWAQAARAGDWIADRATGCRIWNPNPATGESASWSGACRNGYAEGAGVVQWFRSGQPYERDEGSWNAGRQGGQAVQVWATGRYDGEVRDGLPHGRGLLRVGESRYRGEFSGGKPNGTGVLENARGIFQGVWDNGCLRKGGQVAAIGIEVSSCR